MNRFSYDDQSRVFADDEQAAKPVQVQEGDWIDLYELLQVPPHTSTFDLDEAIVERGADAVYFTFSKQGRPAHIAQLEKHLPEMRPILLDPTARRRYDEQCELHRRGDLRAMTYEHFLLTLDIRETSGCLSALLPVAFFLGAGVLQLLTT